MDKQSARLIIKDRLNKATDLLAKSEVICTKLKNINLDAKSILLYKALNKEVNVNSLIEYYLDTSKVFLPKVKGDDMVLVEITKDTKYSLGPFNIQEPIGKELNVEDVDIDVCITPLLGFDDNLNRIGKGKGYYDKFFAKSNCKKIGVAFEIQKISDVIFEKHDVKLDMVITEDKIYANN